MTVDQDTDREQRLGAFLHRAVYPDASAVEIVDMFRPTGGASWETYICTLRVARDGADDLSKVVIKRAPADGPSGHHCHFWRVVVPDESRSLRVTL